MVREIVKSLVQVKGGCDEGEGSKMEWLTIAPVAGVTSIAFALYLYTYVDRQDSGNPRMREIAAAIKEGANAYLKRQYQTLAAFVAVMAVILAIASRSYQMSIAYVLGSVCSGLAGFLG